MDPRQVLDLRSSKDRYSLARLHRLASYTPITEQYLYRKSERASCAGVGLNKEINASQTEGLGRSCLSIACSALSLARSAQAERDNESCFFGASINYVARPRGGISLSGYAEARNRGEGVESKATWFSSDENFVE
ncbi:hypothetical protein EVAR_30319_1 [Eumeta japonica]|uniref:Uncharacterized protein n=1 Tax=Eumeta variegata TaxID=151549 RepID=A0A4C1WBT7_EUMVA|nr:hypothetical protein EVAR_30319_1 [Eumeta japonica]